MARVRHNNTKSRRRLVGGYSMKKIEVFFLQIAQMSSSKFVD